MAYSPLADRLQSLPFMLAGPILRQVTASAVTVWVAVKDTVEVTLTVYDKDTGANRAVLMQGKRLTTGIGKNLHIVAVTARADNALNDGRIYFYDLEFFSPVTQMKRTLPAAITASGADQGLNRLTYAGFALPSFALPPSDLNKVRLLHGSCRKPHGGGQVPGDAMEMVDLLIANDAKDPTLRPHQLYLTGDQIYADEVEESLLYALTDAGDALLDWKRGPPTGSQTNMPESLPGVSTDGPYQAEPLARYSATQERARERLPNRPSYTIQWDTTPWSRPSWAKAADGAPKAAAAQKISAREKPASARRMSPSSP